MFVSTYKESVVYTRQFSHHQSYLSLQRFSWFNQSSDLVTLYIDYLTSLLSAQTCYLRSVLHGLVSQLWQPLPQPGDSEGDSNVYPNIHRAIQAILELVPTAPSLLATLLTKHFPFKGKSPEIQVSNCSN